MDAKVVPATILRGSQELAPQDDGQVAIGPLDQHRTAARYAAFGE
jgi:hypothetical protein